MAKQTELTIKGMHCASCASIIERALLKTQGIVSVNVNFSTERATCSFGEFPADGCPGTTR